jgi:sortase A
VTDNPPAATRREIRARAAQSEPDPREEQPDPAPRPKRPRHRVSVLGVIGELFITVGVVALLYVAWQMWIGDIIISNERADEARNLSEQWQQEYEAAPTTPAPTPTEGEEPAAIEPIIGAHPAEAEVFGNMYVPRWGADYASKIAGGVTRANTLDPIGIGLYDQSPMPGDIGSLAGHRTTYGKPFNRIADLHVGDAIVIETADGWYTYRFRTLEYVRPDQTEVLLPVPGQEGVSADGRYLTMTACSPMYSLAERIVAYSVFDSFTPRSAGAPASLTEAVT